MTSNIFSTPTTEPLEVSIVRPKRSETLPLTMANLFIMTPIIALIVWATFLGVGNELLHSDVDYWQALLLTVGIRYLRGGTPHVLWTRKNPEDGK